jgi:hypothetical protein
MNGFDRDYLCVGEVLDGTTFILVPEELVLKPCWYK